MLSWNNNRCNSCGSVMEYTHIRGIELKECAILLANDLGVTSGKATEPSLFFAISCGKKVRTLSAMTVYTCPLAARSAFLQPTLFGFC